MKKKKTLGRGLWALIHREGKDHSGKEERGSLREGSGKGPGKNPEELPKKGREHALRTYRKILKKCVTEEGVGEMYEAILKELREHFNITEEEHQMILKSVLGKAIPVPPAGEKEKKVIVVEKSSQSPEDVVDKEEKIEGSGEVEEKELSMEDNDLLKEPGDEQDQKTSDEEETLGEDVKKAEEEMSDEVMEIEKEALPSGGKEKVARRFDDTSEILEDVAGGGESEPPIEEEYEEVDPVSVIEEAEKLFEAGDQMGALALLNETLSRFESAELYNELGLIFYRLGEYAASESAFERAVELGGEDPTPLINLAMLQAEVGKYEEALRNMRGALRRDPTNEHILNNLAYICGRMGLYSEALEYLDELLQLNPKSVEGWFNRGVIYEKMREYEKAYIAYDKVLSLDPSNKVAKKAREELFGKLR